MLLYLAILALSLAVLWIRKRYSYWSDRDVRYLKPTFPFGNIRGLGRKEQLALAFQRLYLQLKGSGPFGGVFFFVNPVAMALDLDFVKNVLVKDFQHFHDRSIYYNERDDPLSAHLVTIEGTKWRNLRTKLTPTFSSGKMKMMFPTIMGVAEQFKELLLGEVGSGGEVEMKEILARFTTDVIGTCAFGLECNSLHDSEAAFRRMGRKVMEPPPGRLFVVILAQQFRKIARALRVKTIDTDVSQFFMNAVRETVEYREKNHVERNDFMNLLIKMKNGQPVEDGTTVDTEGLTLEEIAAQAFVFFLAGFETSSTAMTYCLYELARNPELQQKARDDVLKTIKKHGSLTYEAAHDMHYIEMCINESLRKYPPIGQLTRTVSKDYKVPGTEHTLEKGTTVAIPVYGIHHDPEFYADPERYDPDRFLPEELAKRNPYSFLPFGEGPRNCIGLRFGMMQARIGLATLLKDFRIRMSSKTQEPLRIDAQKVVLTFEGGLWLHIEKI
ncbi:hypothetical protein pipiens_012997 [Culex pipiens pipiens]|uniref:Cytochrome P450 n=1 Tax=Culex pipiens pipiens TaxID=38569 RepID=A0ABD1D2U1_CULPP